MKCKNFGIKCNIKRACFNFKGLKPEFCKKCSKSGMIDLVHRMCIDCNIKRPCFGLSGEIPNYCKKCSKKRIGMLNLVNKKCIICNDKIANFNIISGSRMYCFRCKTPEMIDVTHKKCIICNDKRANFNTFGQSPDYCFGCKAPEMIDVTSKRCIICKDKFPSFNISGETKPLYCFNCKTPEMLNISSRKCITCNDTRATFNFITEKIGIYCLEHAEKFMVNIADPHYNCDSCGLRYRVSKENQTLCGYCNPDRNHKTKENEIKKLLEKNNYTFIQDKSIALDKTVCKSYRPDFLFDCTFHYVIIEVDEFKHRGTANTCDYNRMEAIQKILGLPVTFIRYNPDSKEFSKLERESKLLEKLDFYLNLKIQKLDDLNIHYLFY